MLDKGCDGRQSLGLFTLRTITSMRSVALVLALLATPVLAQTAPLAPARNTRAEPAPKIDTIPAARDIAFPGTMSLAVDASDVRQGIFRIKQHIPVPQAGDFVLLYPKWLPGDHQPSGEIQKLAGLQVSAGGRPLTWIRDTIDMFAFHVAVPKGVTAIDAEFQYVSSTAANQGRIMMTPDMESIQWTLTSLYPAGYFVRNIPVEASVTVPQGWTVASALRPTRHNGATTTFETVSYDTLIDSPAIAGAHYKRIPLSDDVAIDALADTPEELTVSDPSLAAHKRLIAETLKLFGAQHYDHYVFLVTITKNLGDIGLEHHRSSEDALELGYFSDWDNVLLDRYVLPHEFVHSWNGKYRRGKDLWTPDYRTPMEDSLLWVYEGQTQFWGYVLAARSGFLKKEDALGYFATVAATFSHTPGRSWRPLIDTTNDPIIADRPPQAWRSWQRAEDYYSEGLLIWTDVDRIIRQQSRGRHSLDDFARAFFGVNNGDWGELTYTFEDVVATLNAIQPYDWADYLRRKVNDVAEKAPLEGFTEGGYRLAYTDQPTNWWKAAEKARDNTDFSYSGGFVLNKEGKVTAVVWDGAAFNAGLTVGSELLAVDGRSFSADRLKTAIKDAKTGRDPIRLLVKSGDTYRTLDLAWHDGLRYPRFEKSGKGTSTVDALLAPR